MFSVLILTYNEAANILPCLESISWCDDIVVLDSFSDDQTVDTCAKAGARVFQRKFDGFAGQRNHALDMISFKHSWVFHLDADERFTPELYNECNILAQKNEKSAYLVPSKMIFMGKWLRHAATYPVFQMRFMKLGEARFEQFGHGQRECNLSRGLGVMKDPYLHYSFSKGFADWFDKHNRYSTQEAMEQIQDLKNCKLDFSGLFCSDSIRRRRAWKSLSWRLPLRPLLKFLYLYGTCRGFLDGTPGLHYAALQSVYEYMTCLKVKEYRERKPVVS